MPTTELPAWLSDQSRWIASSGERGVAEFFAGAQAVQNLSNTALDIQAKKNQLAVQPAMNLLRLQDLQLQVEDQKQKITEVGQDQEAAAQWMQDKQYHEDAPEPAWKSEKYQQMSWMRDQRQSALDLKKLQVENQLSEATAREQTRKEAIVVQKNKAAIEMNLANQRLELARKALAAKNAGTGHTTAIERVTAAMQSELDLASKAETPEIADLHKTNAANYEAWIKKQGTFAPPKETMPSQKTYQRDASGNVTNVVTKPILAPVVPKAAAPVKFKPGQRVQNPKTGEMGTVNEKGIVIPDSAY